MLVARRLHESVETPQRAADPPRPVGYLRNDHRRHDRTRVGFGFPRRNGGLDQAHGIDATGLAYDALRCVEEHDDGYHPRERSLPPAKKWLALTSSITTQVVNS